MSLFLVASVLAGLSQEMWQFILFRGLQGLGGGAVFPIALAVVADLYTPAERGKYLGLFGAVFGAVIARRAGDRRLHHRQLLTGIGSSSSTCRSALISLFILWRLLPAIKRPDAAKHIDYVGAAVFTLAIAPFLIGLTNKAGRATGPIRASAA